MSENHNPAQVPAENQPADELDEEQLNEVAGGGGPQQGILPYIEQDNVYKQNQPPNPPPTDNFSLNFTKIEYK